MFAVSAMGNREAGLVNVAAWCVATTALGPGRRSVVWVQGCPFRCRGCIAPDWIPNRPAELVDVDALTARLLADPAVDGLTFSGGEPMAQAGPLAAVARRARQIREVSLVCFTGYRIAQLRSDPPAPGVADLLTEIDVLIDGPYVEARNDDVGLRGSANQTVHHLTERLTDCGYDFTGRARNVEVRIGGDDENLDVLLVGVPTRRTRLALSAASARIESRFSVAECLERPHSGGDDEW